MVIEAGKFEIKVSVESVSHEGCFLLQDGTSLLCLIWKKRRKDKRRFSEFPQSYNNAPIHSWGRGWMTTSSP